MLFFMKMIFFVYLEVAVSHFVGIISFMIPRGYCGVK
jgi:hypothetical protein